MPAERQRRTVSTIPSKFTISLLIRVQKCAESKHKCAHCGKSFARPYELKRHIATICQPTQSVSMLFYVHFLSSLTIQDFLLRRMRLPERSEVHRRDPQEQGAVSPTIISNPAGSLIPSLSTHERLYLCKFGCDMLKDNYDPANQTKHHSSCTRNQNTSQKAEAIEDIESFSPTSKGLLGDENKTSLSRSAQKVLPYPLTHSMAEPEAASGASEIERLSRHFTLDFPPGPSSIVPRTRTASLSGIETSSAISEGKAMDFNTPPIRTPHAGLPTPSAGVSSLRPWGATTDRRGRRRRLPAPSAEYQQDVSTLLGALELEVALDDVLSKQMQGLHASPDAASAPHAEAADEYWTTPSCDNGNGSPHTSLLRTPVLANEAPDIKEWKARSTDHTQYWTPNEWHGPADASRAYTSFVQASPPPRWQNQQAFRSAWDGTSGANKYSNHSRSFAQVSDVGPRVTARISCIRSTARASCGDALLHSSAPDYWES